MSIFGGPAWTRIVEADGNPGQWYLHLFDAEQPDLNWSNREIRDDFLKTHAGADGKAYAGNENGLLTVLAAGREAKKLGEIDFGGSARADSQKQ